MNDKKYGIVVKKIKGKQLSKYKLIRMWQESYLYLVFVERNNRAFSQFIYVLTLIPFLIIIIEILTPIIPLKDLPTDEGIAHVLNKKGKGTTDMLILYKENNKIKAQYHFSVVDNVKEQLDGKWIKIWYQKHWGSYWFINSVKRIEYQGEPFVKSFDGKFLYNYAYQGERVSYKLGLLPFLGIGFLILGVFLLWIFFLNYKEKPIHRLNRMKDKGITFKKEVV
jgi:hypothetical protein